MASRPPEKLIRILACPACSVRPPVYLSKDGKWVVCEQCQRHYPVKSGIPIMLTDAAASASVN